MTAAKIRKGVVDFTKGKMLKNIVLFTIPGLLIAVVQLIFDNVGMIVIGKTGTVYQAAVGAGAPVINFGLSFLIHLAGGGGLAMAIAVGKGDEEKQNKILHTSIAFSLTFGPIVGIVGFIAARPLLIALDTPADCLNLAVLYIRVYFLCAPARLAYNFAMSVTRGLGDSDKPLRYVLAAGIVKMAIIFLSVFALKWHVVGIALSTVIAEYVAAVWGLWELKKGYGNVRWRWKDTKIHGRELRQIFLMGFPTVLGGWSLSFGGLVMQSKINLYGSAAVAGSAVAAGVNNIVALTSTAFTTTIGTFVGQNWGAKEYRRVRKGLLYIAGMTMAGALLTLGAVVLFKESVFGLFNNDPAVLQEAYLRMQNDLLRGSFLQSLANIYGMALSGMGYAAFPMLTNFSAVIVNVLWAWVFYPMYPSLRFLYLVYPVTGILTGLGDMLIAHVIVQKFVNRQKNADLLAAEAKKTDEERKNNGANAPDEGAEK